MGDTNWGEALGTGIDIAGSFIADDKASDATADASAKYKQDALDLMNLEQQWNRSNTQFARDQNRAIANENQERNLRALAYNRPDQYSDFGSQVWERDDDGNVTQRSAIAPELQDALGAIRGNYEEGINNLDMGDFGTDNNVMNSIRELQAPGIQQGEDAQRARYAAMGIPIQSTIMDRGESSLGDTRNRADLDAIIAGNTAWQEGQSNLRNNLGAYSQLENNWKQNAEQDNNFAQLAVPNQNETGVTSGVSFGNIMKDSNMAGLVAGQGVGNSWEAGTSAASNAAKNIWNNI